MHDVVSCGGCRFPHGAQFCSSQWLRLTMFCMCVRTIMCMCAYRPGVSPTTHVAVMDSDADGLGMGTGRFLTEVYSTGGAQRTCLAARVAYVHVHAYVFLCVWRSIDVFFYACVYFSALRPFGTWPSNFKSQLSTTLRLPKMRSVCV
jgi:hypothetical protein